ncbi:MAG: glycosyltransferase [Clostridia bacterium]|nr:glycosyltransferase [Clostridia bacterium]
MKKVAIIGQYGEGPDYLTGQAVKTYFTANWMIRRFGTDQVEIVNTYGWKKKPFRLFASLFHAMRTCSNVMIFPAQHGVKVFPLAVSILNKLFHRRTFFIVIGGWLADFLKEHRAIRWAVKCFDEVCAETESLARQLRASGVQSAWHLPNCRDYANPPAKQLPDAPPFKVCTYSRVTESKGIGDAVKICRRANELLGSQVFQLEVYGMITKDYQEAFDKLCASEKDIMRYCGTKNADEALSVLQNQFALLFPTYYEGECFAGTALDAFQSRTPIIANDWKYNSEVIRDGENGFLYAFRNVDEAAQKLAALYRDPPLYRAIQKGCEQSAHAYDSDAVLKKLTQKMA